MKTILLLNILTVFSFYSCVDKPMIANKKEVIIAGKIINYNNKSGKNILTVYINDNGRAAQINHSTKVDSSGNFQVKFYRYYPQDVMIAYKTHFQAIVHPGDSIFVEFDGETRQRIKLLESVRFSGDAASLNSKLVKYLKNYFETRPSTKLIHEKEKALIYKDYIKFQDSIRSERNQFREDFFASYKPSKELRRWINLDIQYTYYNHLVKYPSHHKKLNKLQKDWKIDDSYYMFLNDIDPIKYSDLIHSGIQYFINEFYFGFVFRNARKKSDPDIKKITDDLIIHEIDKLSTKDGLLYQLILNNFLNSKLSRYDTAYYAKNEEKLTKELTEVYLIEPLKEHYKEIIEVLNQTNSTSGIEMDAINDKSVSDIWKNILDENRGKVVYVDCWATWCAPCISEFANSKRMTEEYKNTDIVFVYLCLKSDKDNWRKLLTTYELEGEHYFCDDNQSAYFMKLFKAQSFPSYAIINKKGRIVRTGKDFRPTHEITDKIIREILNLSGKPNA